MSASLSRRLAQLVVDGVWDRPPAGAMAYQKALTLDFLGIALAARREPWTAAVARTFAVLGGAEESTALTGGRLPAPNAAYVNSLLAHSTDWDDSHLAAVVHPGAVVLPAALAVGERAGADGRRTLAAALAGYEVMIRLGRSIQPHHMRQGFHGTATCGVFGSAAAAARLLGLDAATTAHALGLAASSASGLAQFFHSGSSVKSFQVAKSAHDGIMAALMAAAGLDAPADALEGEKGFLRAYAAGAPRRDPLDEPGVPPAVLQVMVKRYPIAAHLHGAVDAAMRLAGDVPETLDRISSIEVFIDPTIAGNNALRDPGDLQAARMSLPFCVACALWANRDRAPDRQGLDAADLVRGFGRAGVTSLARRVQPRPWAGAPADDVGHSLRAAVVVHAEGRRLRAESAPSWGWQGQPTIAEVTEKFVRATAGLLDAPAQRRLIEAVMCLDGGSVFVSGLFHILLDPQRPRH